MRGMASNLLNANSRIPNSISDPAKRGGSESKARRYRFKEDSYDDL